MKITPNQRFRDGETTYEPDEEYDVPDGDGAFFVRSGWATSPDFTPPGVATAPDVVEVQPDSTEHGQQSEEV